MRIAEISGAEFDHWISLRAALWPKESKADLIEDASRTLADADQIGFIAFQPDGIPMGFIEAAIYRDAENASPRGHIEAWYVLPERRGEGVGRALLAHAEQWCLHRAIHRLTSDTNASYPVSPAAHEASGFRKLAELQIYLKELTD
ncbi:MAG: GNAT family N-acetyltransferase [Verrucomicrobiae bacterium]|nr:GNAT family N-acetyltransferase [Verrucomicrobiae bacterium]